MPAIESPHQQRGQWGEKSGTYCITRSKRRCARPLSPLQPDSTLLSHLIRSGHQLGRCGRSRPELPLPSSSRSSGASSCKARVRLRVGVGAGARANARVRVSARARARVGVRVRVEVEEGLG